MIDGERAIPPLQFTTEGRIAFKDPDERSSKVWGKEAILTWSQLARGMTQRFAEFVEFFSYDHAHCGCDACEGSDLGRYRLAAGGDLAAL